MWLTLSFVIASTWLVCHVEHFENIQSEREPMRCTPNSGFFISVNLNQRIFNRCSQFKWARIVYANARTNIYPFMDDSTIKTKWKKIYKYMSCECNLEAPIKRTGRYFFLCSILLFAIIEWCEWIVDCCFFCILVLGDHFRRTWHRHKRWIFRWYWSTTRTHQCLLQWSFR